MRERETDRETQKDRKWGYETLKRKREREFWNISAQSVLIHGSLMKPCDLSAVASFSLSHTHIHSLCDKAYKGEQETGCNTLSSK